MSTRTGVAPELGGSSSSLRAVGSSSGMERVGMQRGDTRGVPGKLGNPMISGGQMPRVGTVDHVVGGSRQDQVGLTSAIGSGATDGHLALQE